LTDIYGVVPPHEKALDKTDKNDKPQKKADALKIIDPWLIDVGQNSRTKILQKRGHSSNYDKLIMFLGFCAFGEILIVLIEVLLKRL
jgi:hypothetical protein